MKNKINWKDKEETRQYHINKNKEWYLKNKEKHLANSKEWAKNHRAEIVKIVQRYVRRNKEKVSKYNSEFNKTPMGRYRYYKCRVGKRGFEFLLTLEKFTEIISKFCIYCGENEKPRGIDRVDNLLGYTIENSVPSCNSCNMMKKIMTKEEFLSHIEKIYLHNNR